MGWGGGGGGGGAFKLLAFYFLDDPSDIHAEKINRRKTYNFITDVS